MNQTNNLTGKIAIITGGEGGIGRTLVNAFAAAGATVVSVDLQQADMYREQPNVYFFQADISDSKQVALLFDHVTRTFGSPHILINNAAMAYPFKPIREITDAEFDRVIAVNLCGSFYCSRAFIHANEGEAYGRIIQLGSTRWNQNEAGMDAYGASKGGIVSLTSSLAVSLSDCPITVNCISPGWIETGDYSQLSEADHLQHPSRRVGKPDDIARAALFLAQPENDFINGENLVIDGGMTKRMFYI